MIRRIGFACVMYGQKLSTNHTFRLANLSPEALARAVGRNMADLEAMLAWMGPRDLRLLRIGSSFVPFASHESMNLDWEPLCLPNLRRIGERYAAMDFRFSLHPGQFNVLNSTSDDVRRRTVRELAYSCRVLELMGLDASHKVIIHGGSGGEGASARLRRAIEELPAGIRGRLALENDERVFSFAQVIGICADTGLVPVFDLLHHRLNPCADLPRLLERSVGLWQGESGHGRPKVHLSSQRAGARAGAHADCIAAEDAQALCEMLPWDADCMIEAKTKEMAALGIKNHLRACRP